MKEIMRVHLAKTAYDIEVEAKKALEKYLKEIERMMGSEDAMYEIEARMVELLAERGVMSGGVITKSDVAGVRAKTGEPKDFSDDETPQPSAEAPDEPTERPVKRLMRDPDHAILGGVCAGIAAYWGINPLWIRILFVISPFISFGTSILIYIVLWISMSEARTAAEKLQMRGEAITLDTLKKFSRSDETKPPTKHGAVKVMQVLIVSCLCMMTAGLLIALPVGLFTGVSIVAWMDGFIAQPWAWGVLISLLIGGAAAATLFGVLTSSAARWKFTQASVVALIVSTVIGAFSVSSAAIFGAQMMRDLAQDEQRLTKFMTVDVPKDLEGVKYVDVVGD